MKRRILLGSGAVVLAGIATAGWKRNELMRGLLTRRQNDGLELTDALPFDTDTCVVTPEQVEGPYYIRSPVRVDIREDRPGLPFELDIQVTGANDCQPVEGATVEIWHCDKAGVYSGFIDTSRSAFDTMRLIAAAGPGGTAEVTNDRTFLRGAQTTSADGRVGFKTIFPGWYETRVTHIHIKVSVGDKAYVTSQLYFPEALANGIYAEHQDYKPHGLSPYTHMNDLVLSRSLKSPGLLLRPTETSDGLRAEAKLAIA